MGWREKIQKAKRNHRPLLGDNWENDGLYNKFPSYCHDLSDRTVMHLCDSEPPNLPTVLDAKHLTTADFEDRYEARNIPCVIKNIPAGYDGGKFVGEWAATSEWYLDKLYDDEQLRDRLFKCGEDDDGKKIKVKLKHFLRYLQENHDDSPLYIFDTSFDEDRLAKRLLTDYTVPSYFSDDLFRFVSESRRAPYRWFLVGPERSGTTVHIDPLATSAWNTLIVGKKRWVLFPPHVLKSIVKGKGLVDRDEDDEAIHYFMYILPRIKRKAVQNRHLPEYRDFTCYEFTQHAGETCFIPNGWWHAVLNLTDTVGVTQNFCSPRNFDHVWLKTRSGRKRMAWKWLCQLDKHYPHLADRAREYNKRDGFVMKYDPAEMERRKRQKQGRDTDTDSS